MYAVATPLLPVLPLQSRSFPYSHRTVHTIQIQRAMATNGEKKSIEPHYKLPSEKTLEEAGELSIQDADGKKIKLSTLYTNKPSNERQLIIFIRHFFCGNCEEYIRALARSLPPSVLSPHHITLTVIGCGAPVCIPDYKARTGCPFDMYADPERALYRQLDMQATLTGSYKRPEYMTKSLGAMVWSSIWTGIAAGRQGLMGGKFSQNGGEWLFEGGRLVWCHRMRNTADHAEVEELKQVLGLGE